MTESYIWKSYDWDKDALEVFEVFKNEPNSFFLDSSLNIYGMGRFSFIGADPFLIFKTKGQNPFKKLRNLLNQYRLPSLEFSPFLGGAMGYFGYDLGSVLERIPSYAEDDLNLPDCFLGFYDAAVIIDRLKRKLYIFSSGFPEKSSILAKKRANIRLKWIENLLSKIPTYKKYFSNNFRFNSKDFHTEFKSNFTKQAYLSVIKKALDYISRGDIYQVNLSQRFCIDSKGMGYSAIEIYKILRLISPTCFSAVLDCGNFEILSASPEEFLKLRGNYVQTRPMKGTRPRGVDPSQDQHLKKELLDSLKDRAELLMIVDLERNDLGRVCEYGRVKVKDMRTLEAYSTVFQTTSTVEGTLHKDKDRIDLIKACFPGGSITGCPKIRAMQIIEELEPTKRAIYTGSLGYLSFSGDMDLNILIRTLLLKNNKIYFQVGGGIVSDSEPEKEYEETLVKARALFSCLANYKLIGANV